jgi:formylglycine-generating enzyme required for sulfatase activity
MVFRSRPLCRAGTTTLFYTGDDEQQLAEAAWYGDAEGHVSKQTALKQPNAFGLYDMHGNVYEWVHDAFRQDWYESLIGPAAVDPRCDVASEGKRIVRGGDYGFSAAEVRSASRDAYNYDSLWWDAGFRVALSVEAVRDMEAAAGRVLSQPGRVNEDEKDKR